MTFTSFRAIGRTVLGALCGGVLVALALVLGPVAGAPEHVITGTILMAFAGSWALLTILGGGQTRRWAWLPAGFMALAGGALLAFTPATGRIQALGWVWPPVFLAVLTVTALRVRRHLHSRTRFWVVYPLLGVYALAAIGGGYQTIREELDLRTNVAHGRLVDVGGRRLHLVCAGSGSPTVILEAALGESSAYWGWIAPAIASDAAVCAYDRAGRGWSDPASGPQDGVAIADDLHALLERGGVRSPLVIVAHSSGAQYGRIFAGRYPQQVAGMVLLDAQPANAFDGLPDYPAFYAGFRRVSALLPSLARLGVGRLVFHNGFRDMPADAAAIQRVTYSSTRQYRSLRDEFAQLPQSLEQARTSPGLGDRPLVVVTATVDTQRGWLPLQDALATLSTNSSHRLVPYTHEALVTDRVAAQHSIRAIRDVIHAVRFTTRIETVVAGR